MIRSVATDPLRTLVTHLDAATRKSSHYEVDSALRAFLPPLVRDSDGAEEDGAANIWQTATSWAFGYRVALRTEKRSRRIIFEPFFAMSDGEQMPPKIAEVDDEVVDAWEALAAAADAPYARARLEHVLFERRRGNGAERARAAAKGYLEASGDWERGRDRVVDLSLALHLARAVGAEDIATEVLSELTHRAECALQESDPVPQPRPGRPAGEGLSARQPVPT